MSRYTFLCIIVFFLFFYVCYTFKQELIFFSKKLEYKIFLNIQYGVQIVQIQLKLMQEQLKESVTNATTNNFQLS